MANSEPLVFFRLQLSGDGASLIAEAPTGVSVKPALALSWDFSKQQFRLTAGVTAETEYYPATEFPEWLRGQLFRNPSGAPAPLTRGGGSIPLPDCAAIQNSNGSFLTFVEYEALRRAMRNSTARNASPLHRSTQAAAASVVYPPLTRSVYDTYVGYCWGRKLSK